MLTPRQETILRLIVDVYISTAVPISSEKVVQSHDLRLSPATIRKEVAALEESGYITRPHSSAGSVPLDKAYRFYVEPLVAAETDRIPARTRNSIRKKLNQVQRDVDEWTSVAAAILSRLVGNMAIATFPKAKESRVRHLELVPLQDLSPILIVVLEHARVRRQLLSLNQPVGPSELEVSTNRIKGQALGLTEGEIESQVVTRTPLEEEMVKATIVILREENRAIYRGHYVDGLRNLLRQPEFAENDKVHTLVEGVEDGSLVQAVLEETPDGGMVRVIIGQENRGDMLWPLSVVICQYGRLHQAVGALGAVGPTRMEYSKAISGVQFMSSVMSDLAETVHAR